MFSFFLTFIDPREKYVNKVVSIRINIMYGRYYTKENKQFITLLLVKRDESC